LDKEYCIDDLIFNKKRRWLHLLENVLL
jgi:hypothetical protein